MRSRLVALVLAMAPANAFAQPSVVVLALDVPDDALNHRVRAELASLGVAVVGARTTDAHDTEGLRTAARRENASALILAYSSGDGVELEVLDADASVPVHRDHVRAQPSRAVDRDLVATRLVELVRAHFLERSLTAKGDEPPLDERARQQPRVKDEAAERTPASGSPSLASTEPPEQSTLLVGPGVTLGPGIGGQGELWIGAEHKISAHEHMAALALVPVVGSAVETTGSRARVNTGLAGVAAGTAATLPRPWLLQGDVGVSVAWLHAGGDKPSTAWALMPYVHTALGAELRPRVVLRTDILVGAALWQQSIIVGDHGIAQWGRPMLSGALVLCVRLLGIAERRHFA